MLDDRKKLAGEIAALAGTVKNLADQVAALRAERAGQHHGCCDCHGHWYYTSWTSTLPSAATISLSPGTTTSGFITST